MKCRSGSRPFVYFFQQTLKNRKKAATDRINSRGKQRVPQRGPKERVPCRHAHGDIHVAQRDSLSPANTT